MSLCPTNFVYNNETHVCDKFDFSDPTNCTIHNRDNLYFTYYPFTKTCRYKNNDIDNPIELHQNPICPSNTITMPDNSCKRFVVSIPPLPQSSKSTSLQDYQPASQKNPQPAVNETIKIVYIILFFIICFFIGYIITFLFIVKKNSNSFNR